MKNLKKIRKIMISFLHPKKGRSVPRQKKHQGVSLIETIITVVILAFAVSGAIYLMMTIVESTNKNKKRITAIYLAQECTELVRNLRDSAWKQNLPWDCAFTGTSQTYRISPNATLIPPIVATAPTVCQNELGVLVEEDDGTPDFFRLNKGAGSFSHEDTVNVTTTDFRRKLKITKDSGKELLTATCEVWWNNRFSKEKIEVEEILTNWKKH